MTTLVIGATGFIGGYLTQALCRLGEPVRILARRTSDQHALAGLPIEVVYGDLSDTEALAKSVHGVRRIINCAGKASDWGPWSAFQAANITGVENLLRTARAESRLQRLVHVSTADVYGYPNRRHVTEESPWVDRGFPYNSSKIAGERLAWQAYREHGIPLTIVRPASVYGPGDPNFVLRIVTMMRSHSMILVDGGRAIAGLHYVENLVDLLLLAAERPAAIGMAFNASDDSTVTWRQYVDRLAQAADTAPVRLSLPYKVAYALGWAMEAACRPLGGRVSPPVTRQAVENTGIDQDYPAERARRMLGYTPRVSFDEGMERVARWLRET